MTEQTERIAILLELENDKFKKNAKTAGAAIDRLERKHNPLIAAEAKLTRQQLQFNAALEAGTITAKRHAAGMDLAQREYDQSAAKLARLKNNVVAMNSATAAQTGFMTRNRAIFQQGGYQVGDFAVQVQGGTSALTAFTQQGSQLLGVFGPWGAVMGAVLAVGAPLAGFLLGVGSAAEKTGTKAKTFADKLSAAESALDRVREASKRLTAEGFEGLQEKYGTVTEAVIDLQKRLLEVEKTAAKVSIGAVMDEAFGENVSAQIAGALEEGLGSVGEYVLNNTKEKLAKVREEYKKAMTYIQQETDAGGYVSDSTLERVELMRQQIALLEGDLKNAGTAANAIGPKAQAVSEFLALGETIRDAVAAADFETVSNSIPEFLALAKAAGVVLNDDVVAKLAEAEDQARQMKERFEEAKDVTETLAGTDLTTPINEWARAALLLAQNMGIALVAARQIVDAQARLGEMRTEFSPGGQARIKYAGRGTTSDTAITDGRGWELKDGVFVDPDAKSKRGGGGGKGKTQTDLFAEADKQIEKLKLQIELLGKSDAEVASLTLKYKLLAEAKKRGIPITDELTAKIEVEAAKVGKLAAESENAKDRIETLQKAQDDWESSVVDAAMGGVDAMDQFIDSIKRAALEYALFGKGMFASEGSGFKGILGSVVGGIFGKLANGGPASGGNPYLVNENTPNSEIFVPSRGGGVLNVPQAQAALRGSSAGTENLNVTVTMDPSTGALGAFVTNRAGQVLAKAQPNLVRQSVAAVGRANSTSKDYFG